MEHFPMCIFDSSVSYFEFVEVLFELFSIREVTQ